MVLNYSSVSNAVRSDTHADMYDDKSEYYKFDVILTVHHR